MDGTAAVGTTTKYAREDHRHPTDTTRAASTHTHASLNNGAYVAALDAGGNFSITGQLTGGDFQSVRPGTPEQGLLYLGNSGVRYLIYDGTSYTLNGASLYVGGDVVANGGGFVSPGAILASNSNHVYMRPYGVGNATSEAYNRTDGVFVAAAALQAPSLYGYSLRADPYATGMLIGGTNAVAGIALRPNNFNNGSGEFTIANGGPGNITAASGAFKPGGGAWAATSDERIKTVTGDYTTGLDAILALEPITYVYKGNDTEDIPGVDPARPLERAKFLKVLAKRKLTAPFPFGRQYTAAVSKTEYIGLVAQQAECSMPEMVKKIEAYIDGEKVNDLRTLDPSALTYAFINAFKDMKAIIDAQAARIEALEART
jgi:hypothetical protein